MTYNRETSVLYKDRKAAKQDMGQKAYNEALSRGAFMFLPDVCGIAL